MGADIIQARHDDLNAVAARFGQHAEGIAALQARVARCVQALENGGWVGRGSAAFFAEMHRAIYPALARLHDALADAQQVTLEIVRIMEAAEEEAAAVFLARDGAGVPAGGAGVQTVSGLATPAASGSSSLWDRFWSSMPGQQGLAIINFAWGFLAGSGHEIGTSYGPAARVGGFGGDIASSFVLWGDLRDLVGEGLNAATGRDVNELTAILSAAGIVSDLGWLDGPIPDPVDGANLGLATLKALVKQLDEVPKPVRESLTAFIKWGVDNPQRLGDVVEWVQWMLKNHDTPLGRGALEMFGRGARDGDWFTLAADSSQWLKRDPDRFARLAMDPAESGAISAKTIREAHVGLALESASTLRGPLVRDPSGAAEFIDANGIAWDVKSFYSKGPNTFQLDREVRKIEGEFLSNENVILNTMDLGPGEIAQLRQVVQERGWADRIRWYP